MSTKLNAEELTKAYAIEQGTQGSGMWHEGCAFAIREVAQPIADERDEYREALEGLLTAMVQLGKDHHREAANARTPRQAHGPQVLADG